MGRLKTTEGRAKELIGKNAARLEARKQAYELMLKLQKPKTAPKGCRMTPHYPFKFWERRKLTPLTGADKKAYVKQLKEKYRGATL